MLTRLDLSPMRVRRQMIWRREWPRWGWSWLVVASLCGVATLSQLRFNDLTRATLAEMRVATAPLLELDAQTRALTEEIGRAEGQLAEWKQLEQADAPLVMLSTVGQCCREAGSGVLIDRLRMEEFVDSQTTKAPAHPASSAQEGVTLMRRRVQLSGMALDDRDVAAVVVKLRASGLFQSVDLESSQTIERQQRSVRQFQLRCVM